MNLIERLERANMKKDVPVFNIGDDVKIHIKVVEGDKERIQVFEGIIIAKDGSMNRETFTVRKVSYGVGVERVFPIHSPKIEKIEVVKSNRVKRAKLYFLRGRSGKAARFVEKEKFFAPGKKKPAVAAAEAQTATPDEGAAQS